MSNVSHMYFKLPIEKARPIVLFAILLHGVEITFQPRFPGIWTGGILGKKESSDIPPATAFCKIYRTKFRNQ